MHSPSRQELEKILEFMHDTFETNDLHCTHFSDSGAELKLQDLCFSYPSHPDLNQSL